MPKLAFSRLKIKRKPKRQMTNVFLTFTPFHFSRVNIILIEHNLKYKNETKRKQMSEDFRINSKRGRCTLFINAIQLIYIRKLQGAFYIYIYPIIRGCIECFIYDWNNVT